MDKNKVFVPLVVVLALIAVVGFYWLWNCCSEKVNAKTFLSRATALSGNETAEEALEGGSNFSKEVNEIKWLTPKEKFDATEEVQANSDFLREKSAEIEPFLNEVFGAVKLTGFLDNYIGGGTEMLRFIAQRGIGDSDLGKMKSEFMLKGYTLVTSSGKGGNEVFLFKKDSEQLILSCEENEQEVTSIVIMH